MTDRIEALLARIEATDGMGRDVAEAVRILSQHDADVSAAITLLKEVSSHNNRPEDREADKIMRDAVNTLRGVGRLIGRLGLSWPRLVSLALAVVLAWQIGASRAVDWVVNLAFGGPR